MKQADGPTFKKSNLGIWGLSFQGLLWTQWLTAVNDNVFRWFVIGVGKDQFSSENLTTLLVLGSSCFIAPYILLRLVGVILLRARSCCKREALAEE